jgi:hypothetical protein
MADNLEGRLTDPSIVPDDELIRSYTGRYAELWKEILDHASSSYRDISGEWRYYNDGKQWLYKLVQKKKTIFWASVAGDTFRITFYFGDKAADIIRESDIPSVLKKNFAEHKGFGKIRPITVVLGEHVDAETVYKLIELKSKIK